MKREDLLKSPYYWVADIQLSLFQAAQTYMNEHNMNRKQFAEYLGVSKGYVSQLLSGDYNFSIEKLAELAAKIDCAPKIELIPFDTLVERDNFKLVFNNKSWSDANVNDEQFSKIA